MIFIYYLLARAEERECMEKYPDTYPYYFNKTGMFFPKLFSFDKLNIPFPRNKFLNGTTIFLIYAGVVSITILSAISVRNFTISKMSTAYGKDYMAVSVSYVSQQITRQTINIMLEDSIVQKELSKIFNEGDTKMFYIMPQSWILSELGMVAESGSHNNPEQRAVSHGNPIDIAPMKKRVLVSLAKLIRETESSTILNYMKQQVPKLYIDIDLEKGEVINISIPPKEGIYSDIPVPIF